MASTGSGRHWFSLLLIPSEKIFHNERFDSPVVFSCLLARSISFQYNGGIYESDLLGGSMLAHFLPQTVPFFKLLMEQNAVLQRMAQSLIVVMENTYESEGHLKQINILEEEADKLNRKITSIFRRLSLPPLIVKTSTRSTSHRNGWRTVYKTSPAVFLCAASCTSVSRPI